MLEMNKDFYCAIDSYNEEGHCDFYDDGGICECCRCFRRKWPTPEQFREEYGKEVPDDFPVWMYKGTYDYSFKEAATTATYQWTLMTFKDAEAFERNYPMLSGQIVCACTPFGKPVKDWRPE